MEFKITQGWLTGAKHLASEHYNQRPGDAVISLLVIHNISLPPGQFGTGIVPAFFTGNMQPGNDEFLQRIADLRVSAHCFIDRAGQVTQFVSFNDRAWHAGQSSFQGIKDCNNYSIGIELEGTDADPYTDNQYSALAALTRCLMDTFSDMTLGRIVGHNDIAPGRKTDPGTAFDWCRYRQAITKEPK